MVKQHYMKEMFGYGKDPKYVSFPFDWIEPGEPAKLANELYQAGSLMFNTPTDYAGFLVKKVENRMLKIAEERRASGLEPVYWMKPPKKDGNDAI